MAHADTLLYNAVKALTEDPATRAFLEAYDPKALALAREAARTFDEEHAPDLGPEFVVDLYVPFAAVTPAGEAHTTEEAAALVRNIFIAEGLYGQMTALLEDSVFFASDSEWRAEVGEG